VLADVTLFDVDEYNLSLCRKKQTNIAAMFVTIYGARTGDSTSTRNYLEMIDVREKMFPATYALSADGIGQSCFSVADPFGRILNGSFLILVGVRRSRSRHEHNQTVLFIVAAKQSPKVGYNRKSTHWYFANCPPISENTLALRSYPFNSRDQSKPSRCWIELTVLEAAAT